MKHTELVQNIGFFAVLRESCTLFRKRLPKYLLACLFPLLLSNMVSLFLINKSEPDWTYLLFMFVWVSQVWIIVSVTQVTLFDKVPGKGLPYWTMREMRVIGQQMLLILKAALIFISTFAISVLVSFLMGWAMLELMWGVPIGELRAQPQGELIIGMLMMLLQIFAGFVALCYLAPRLLIIIARAAGDLMSPKEIRRNTKRSSAFSVGIFFFIWWLSNTLTTSVLYNFIGTDAIYWVSGLLLLLVFPLNTLFIIFMALVYRLISDNPLPSVVAEEKTGAEVTPNVT